MAPSTMEHRSRGTSTLEHRYQEKPESQSVHAMSNQEIIQSFRHQEGRETLEMKVSQMED